MDFFPFTRKKFTSLSPNTRHKWLIKWLTELYQGLITNRIATDELHGHITIYNTVLTWMDQPCRHPPNHEKRTLLEFVSNAIHAHRVASGFIPKDHDLLPEVILNDTPSAPAGKISKSASQNSFQSDYHLALDGLRSLFNVGSIFRTCDAAGFGSIILGNTPVKDHPTVLKTSMGASGWVPCTQPQDLADALITLKTEKEYPIIGVETVEGSTPHHSFHWPKKAVIVLGNEEYGISSHVMRICDDFVHIPMAGRKNSINVGCATAVIAFHVCFCMNPHNI